MEKTNEASQGDYLVSTDPAKLDLAVIHQYLSKESYWAQNIPVEIVQRSIENSFCFGLYYKDQQVGFGRLITDKATFAYLADVFILSEHRGKGLSKWMINFIQQHPDLQQLRRWMLVTKDAQGLYEQFGWTPLPPELVARFMTKHIPNVYQTDADTGNAGNN
jgi:GNAT superfamily N-acetyltransferase